MEYHKILDKILGQKTKVKILRYLVTHQDEYSGRRIAHETGINHWQCHQVLQTLYKEGILSMRRAGNAYLFSLRKNHYIVEKSIIPLFQTESKLLQNLTKKFKLFKDANWTNISSFILFGSIATAKEKPHSDIDVLVVIKNKTNKRKIAEEIEKKNSYFLSRYGNTLSPYVVTEDEFRKRHKSGDKLIKNIIKHGKIIFGKTIGELVAG